MSKTLATSMAEFAVGVDYNAIPAEVRRAALWHIVDSIGVCIAGASPHEDSGQIIRKLAAKWRSEGATVYGTNAKVRPELAALLNGSLAQALEMDDKHGSSLARPGSTVIPAVLAVAEERNASLREVITAIAVGYEIMIRLGFVGGDRFLERGYHTSSLIGSFGAAAAVGRLVGTSTRQIVDAMGIGGTFASGIQESTRTGSTSKILHGGWGAHAGILAIDLATAGITGPDSVFEGKFGFFQTHLTPITGDLDFAKGGAGFGTRWYLPETAFKPYPCCQLLHAFIEASKRLLKEFEQDGVSLSSITGISCQLAEPGLTLVTEPNERKKAPQTPHEARFSLAFGVASALVHGDVGLETFRADRLGDREVLNLAALVRASVDPESDYPAHCPAILEITAGGKTYRSHVPHHPGCPEAPLSNDDVLDKFARNSGWLFGDLARTVGAQIAATPETDTMQTVIARLANPAVKAFADNKA
ncbi:MmgE/PrpD family protein [Mesorhizobium sp. M7A.F.Ca.US.006.01.1.1]|uniref:MmgE/PrpD family protein n=1 Tax=Mesorhizobium sp. M7A.F.Ca.US.006.01.1.1 TaxID=2496707 RepID=UPI000FCB2FAF|nr:MmgE/PrpD family protein [Mesorhizobium sp. M7A.F.Ca.US.006.01.1.1]RUZ77957.1 MmgE/PrpD family protein [Mesorhizobium sp. M7A.F.Ca.US.006.01.1.1]